MAQIVFTVTHRFNAGPRVVWDEMIDWPAHSAWIPATRVEVHDGLGQEVGETFTGYTGYGPLMLVDRMKVTAIAWDESESHGMCDVEKLGPVLRGRAGFTVTPEGTGSRVDWYEDVTVPYLPQFLAGIANKLGATGFAFGMKKLAKVIAASQ